MLTHLPHPPQFNPEQRQKLLEAVFNLVAVAQSLGVPVTWSPLYNATRPTVIIALENVDPAIFGPPPEPD